MTKQQNIRKMFSRTSALVLSLVLMVSFLPYSFLEAFAAELPDETEQETIVTQTDGLEYQSISTQPGSDDAEIVKLDGLMPVNAEVNVQNSPDYTDDNLFAYDISITDQEGGEFQPETNEPIKVEIKNNAISDACAADQKLRLWHIGADGIREEIKNFSINGDTITFEASGFSVYEVDDGTPALRTYEFWMPDDLSHNTGYHEYYFHTSSKNSDGSFKEIWTQTVKGNEKPVFPQLPADSTSQYTFMGWFVGSENGTMFDFENIPPVSANETVKLYAVFRSCVYAIFHDQFNGRTQTFPVFATRRGDLINDSASIPFKDLTVVYDDNDPNKEEGAPPQMAFKGWSTEPVEDYTTGANVDVITDDVLTLTETTRFYPVFEPIRWLEFVSGETGSGATYIPPVFFPTDEGFSFSDDGASSPPVRAGYVFKGWFTKDGTQVTDAQQNLIAGLDTPELQVRNGRLFLKDTDANGKKLIQSTLYAGWDKGNSKYTIIIWKQKESDDKNAAQKTYDYAESYTFSENVMTEDIVSVANTYKTKNYPGFYYDHCDENKKVAGNGSTVLNVYYDRCTVEYKFLSSKYNNATTLYTWSGLYGQRITKYGYTWDSTNYWIYKKSGTGITYLESFNSISSDDSNYNSTSHKYTTEIYDAGDNSDYKIIHVLQDLDGNYDINNTELVYSTNASGEKITFNFTNKFEGFTVYGYSRNTFTPNPPNNALDRNEQAVPGKDQNVSLERENLYVYHKRNSYPLTFVDSVNRSKTYKTVEVLYQAPIGEFKPADPTTPPIEGYQFTNWYSNEACSSNTVIDFNNTIMPNAGMIIYAGWDTIWFRIEIDPNGGVLTLNQSTFYWEAYNGDPIEEYKTVTRNYEADVNGTYYYMKHDRAYWGLGDEWTAAEDDIKDRGAGYTTDISKATSPTRYREAPGVYRYLGWYEVKENGEEVPYNFGTRITKNTFLRLHWKQLGTYNIRYDAGNGTIDDGDMNEKEFEFLDADDYADHADIVVTRVAKAPEGLNFIGWRIRNDTSGKIYYPGQSFKFSSDYAQSVSQIDPDTGAVETKHVIIMDAVYEEIKTACIIYDANGGQIDTVEAVKPENAGGAVIGQFRINGIDGQKGTEYSATDTQLTVSDLVNNSAVKLSNGVGFSNHGYHFLGWSTQPDGSKNFFDPDSIKTYVDTAEPLVLYAQWEVRVYFDKNNGDDNSPERWGGDWSEYTWDSEKQMYYTTVNLNSTVDKPAYIPTSDNTEEIFRCWSLDKQTSVGVMKNAFDFSTPITQNLIGQDKDHLVLYGCWSAPIKINVHLVDTTNKVWEKHDDWLIDGTDTKIVLNNENYAEFLDKADADAYADAEKISGLDWVFACTQGNGEDDYKNVSEDTMITKIWYDTDAMEVKVLYSDGSEHSFDPAEEDVYLIYYTSPEEVKIRYKLMTIEGTLEPEDGSTGTDLNVRPAAPKTADVSKVPYIMGDTGNVDQPVSWANNQYHYYSFAVGSKNAANASELKIITYYSESDTNRPSLQVENTWRGFVYSTDGVNWHNCGYDMELYVVYYEQRPTIVNLTEKTIGLPEDMSEEFEYIIKIEQTEEKTVKRVYYYGDSNNIINRKINNVDYRTTETSFTETKTIKTINDEILSNGESDSFVLFFSQPADTDINRQPYKINGEQQTIWTYNVYVGEQTIKQKIYQTITIEQLPKTDYTTINDAAESSDNNIYKSSYTSSANSNPVTITYINTHQLKLDLHVALKSGGMISSADDLRTNDADIYEHIFNGAGTWNISGQVTPDELINNSDKYIFLGIISGSKDENGTVETAKNDISSVSFGQTGDEMYSYYFNNSTEDLLGDDDIWFVYCEKPTIVYKFETPGGELIDIDPLTRNGIVYTGNITPISQGEVLPVTSEKGLLLSQISTPGNPAFLIPPDLDHQDDMLKLDLNRLSIGNESEVLIDSNSKTLNIDIIDGDMYYRFNEGDEPAVMPSSPVVYAIYKVKGYELTLSKTVKGDAGGTDDFTFTIRSDSITFNSYYISGYDTETVSADANVIELTLHKDDIVTIYGLSAGDYTITESAEGSFEMTASVNGVEASVTQQQLAANISEDTRIDVVNTYPIPVTGAGETSAPYVIVLVILAASAIFFVLRRKGEIINENSTL